jgi:hypothetical protein
MIWYELRDEKEIEKKKRRREKNMIEAKYV